MILLSLDYQSMTCEMQNKMISRVRYYDDYTKQYLQNVPRAKMSLTAEGLETICRSGRNDLLHDYAR